MVCSLASVEETRVSARDAKKNERIVKKKGRKESKISSERSVKLKSPSEGWISGEPERKSRENQESFALEVYVCFRKARMLL